MSEGGTSVVTHLATPNLSYVKSSYLFCVTDCFEIGHGGWGPKDQAMRQEEGSQLWGTAALETPRISSRRWGGLCLEISGITWTEKLTEKNITNSSLIQMLRG